MSEPDFAAATVHVVGLGLMGGSLAMALHGKVARITATDVKPDVLEAAEAAGVIDGTGTASTADVVVIAIPAGHIPVLLPNLEVKPGALVIDLGSTKTRICDALDQLPAGVRAVGGHPMCGLAENGFRNAVPTLYHGARFVLCETVHTDATARQQAEALVRAISAQPMWMDRARQDALTALTSHLPHLLSFALMALALEASQEDEALFELAAGGFDGATRLARTEASMIVGMFSTNADQLRAASVRMRTHLDRLEALMEDPEQLDAALQAIVSARRTYTARYGERLIT